jgi:hypothetical protein
MPKYKEKFGKITGDVNVRVYRADTGEVLFEGHNTIVNTAKWLFARLMANVYPTAANPPYQLGEIAANQTLADPLYGVWGLALGAGSPSWAPETQPGATPVQTALVAEFLRKPLSQVSFVDSNNNPLTTLSTMVSFNTLVNATTDNITQGIREMGLIGGGTYGSNPPTTETDMLTAPYFNPTAIPPGPQNSVTLINYKTLPPLILPPGVDTIFAWVLSF